MVQQMEFEVADDVLSDNYVFNETHITSDAEVS